MEVISGYRSKLIRLRMHLIILRLAITEVGSIWKGLTSLAEIREKRRKIQGYKRIMRFIRSGKRYFFADNIPGWPSKAFNNQFRSEIRRTIKAPNQKVMPTTIFIAITSRCHLNCRHCYEWENLASKETLSSDQLRAVLAKVLDYGISHIQFSGGEPLLRSDDLTELIRQASERADVWINTTGYGLTAETAYKLKIAGLTGVEISLDHWDEKSHNFFRGDPKSFMNAKTAAVNCNREGILTSLSLCATPGFVTKVNLERYAELAAGWGIGFIRVLEIRNTGRYNEKDSILTSEHIGILEDFYLDSQKRCRSFRYPIIAYPGYHQRRSGCMGAGNRYLYIDPKGDIHACPFCRGASGSALTDSLEEAIGALKVNGCHMFITNPDS